MNCKFMFHGLIFITFFFIIQVKNNYSSTNRDFPVLRNLLMADLYLGIPNRLELLDFLVFLVHPDLLHNHKRVKSI